MAKEQFRLASRMAKLGTETAFEVLGEVKALEAEGKHIVSFCIGEPDFDTPANIRKKAVEAIDSGDTHYTGPQGKIPLRDSISRHMKKTRGLDYSRDDIVVTPGGKLVIFSTIMALAGEGDEVIYPNPGYPIYESAIDFAGAKGIPLPYLEERRFVFELETLKGLITDRTRLIVINSPQNPTGGYVPREDLEELARICVEKDIMVLSDEIYSRLLYEGEFTSIATFPGMKERTIILDGFSKTYAMCGWRLGWAACPPGFAYWVTRMNTNTVSCAPSFVQTAGIEALDGPQDDIDSMVAEFKTRRDLIVGLLNDIEGVSCHSPKGAFYVFPNVTKAVKDLGFADAKELQEYLLYQGNVAVLHRENFGRKNTGEDQEYLRLSYATSQDNIRKGLAMIKAALEDKEKIASFLKAKGAKE
ncbi:MAG: pyridoxal phosphate-dependent aminotransferase [DPANN group archaeon]|nr:pyridoxal phosphate-dependent aminotransferase [DPANN group archaeon]